MQWAPVAEILKQYYKDVYCEIAKSFTTSSCCGDSKTVMPIILWTKMLLHFPKIDENIVMYPLFQFQGLLIIYQFNSLQKLKTLKW